MRRFFNHPEDPPIGLVIEDLIQDLMKRQGMGEEVGTEVYFKIDPPSPFIPNHVQILQVKSRAIPGLTVEAESRREYKKDSLVELNPSRIFRLTLKFPKLNAIRKALLETLDGVLQESNLQEMNEITVSEYYKRSTPYFISAENPAQVVKILRDFYSRATFRLCSTRKSVSHYFFE